MKLIIAIFSSYHMQGSPRDWKNWGGQGKSTTCKQSSILRSAMEFYHFVLRFDQMPVFFCKHQDSIGLQNLRREAVREY